MKTRNSTKSQAKAETKEKSESKTSQLDTQYLSDNTKNHIDEANNAKVSYVKREIKSAPKVIYGAVDLAAGEKVSGAISIATAAPNLVMAEADKAKGMINDYQSFSSFLKDIEHLDNDQKKQAIAEFMKYNGASVQDSIKNNTISKNDISDLVKAVDKSSKSNSGHSQKTNSDKVKLSDDITL